nr:X intrinsic protein [Ipomoea batatas]
MAANTRHVLGDEESHPHNIGGNKRIAAVSSPFPMGDHEWHGDDQKTPPAPVTLAQKLGLMDFFSLNVWRASIGELIGTAVLVFMIDTIVISTFESDIKMPNLVMSVLITIVITILLLAVFPVSGGHINPIISFSAALVGIISMSRAVIYMVAQCVGATLGALALKAVVSSSIENTFSLGGCTLTVIAPGPNGPITVGLEMAQAFWLEIVLSIVGMVLGLLVFVSTTVTATKGYAGAGMNPARCFGAAVVRGGHLWDGHWIFWVGPFIACVAFYLYTKIIPSQHFHATGYPHDFFSTLKLACGSQV